MEDYIVKWVVVGVLSWATAFILARNRFSNRSFDFCNRIVSTMHACLAVCLASFSVEDWRCPVCPLGSKSSPWQMQTLAVTLSYLIYDLLCCLFDNHVSLDNSVHHIVSIVGIGAGLASEKCGSEMVVALWLTEISSPFLHVRELLKELGYKDTDLNLIADITFAVVFSIARMVVGPYLTYVTVMSDNNPLLIKGQMNKVEKTYKLHRVIWKAGLKRVHAFMQPDSDSTSLLALMFMVWTMWFLTAATPRNYESIFLTKVVVYVNFQAMAVGLQAVSAFWFYKIARMVRYKLLKRKGTKKA